MKIITRSRLDALSQEAAVTKRLRMNLNLHDDSQDLCQRLFNAVEPGSYIRPHRHLEPLKPECFMAVRGRMAVLVFNDAGAVEQIVAFGHGYDVEAIDLPGGVWHTLIALEAGSIFFETKPGPYVPLSDKDFAAWAPEEGTPEAADYLAGLVSQLSERQFR